MLFWAYFKHFFSTITNEQPHIQNQAKNNYPYYFSQPIFHNYKHEITLKRRIKQ